MDWWVIALRVLCRLWLVGGQLGRWVAVRLRAQPGIDGLVGIAACVLHGAPMLFI